MFSSTLNIRCFPPCLGHLGLSAMVVYFFVRFFFCTSSLFLISHTLMVVRVYRDCFFSNSGDSARLQHAVTWGRASAWHARSATTTLFLLYLSVLGIDEACNHSKRITMMHQPCRPSRGLSFIAESLAAFLTQLGHPAMRLIFLCQWVDFACGRYLLQAMIVSKSHPNATSTAPPTFLPRSSTCASDFAQFNTVVVVERFSCRMNCSPFCNFGVLDRWAASFSPSSFGRVCSYE